MSLFRTSLLAASACVLSGCALGPQLPPWFSASMLQELQTGQEYSDFIAARYAGMSGDPASAAAIYRRAYGRAPNDANLLENATFATLISGEAQEAIAMVTSANPSVAERSPTAQLALIVEDITNGRSRQALQRLRTAGLGAINADVVQFLILWLTAVENPDQALSLLTQQPARRSLSGQQAVIEGMILLNAGRDDKASEAFARAQRVPLETPGLVASLAARLQASRGDLAGARKTIEAEIEENGAGSATDQVLALIASGKPVPRPRLSTRQGAAIALHLVSMIGIARASPELAVLRFSLALHLDPEFVPARLMLANALDEQDRPEEAIAQLRKVPAGSWWTAEARMSEAWLQDKLDRPAEALAAADAALAASHRRDILIGAADLNRVAGNHARARRLYDEVLAADIAADVRDWRVLYARSVARKAEGDWNGAEADLVAALAIEPDRPELQNALGYGWVDRGEKVEEGMNLIRKAVAARPDQGYIVDSLGWAHFRLGEFDKAVEHLERAAELSPADAEILDHLGDAYWRVGRETDAQYEWEAALAARPDPVREAALRAKIEKGMPPLPAASLASRP